MTIEDYLLGCDLLGGDVGATAAPAATDGTAVVIRVRDVGALVAAKGGAMGALFFKAAPVTATNTAYGQLAEEVASGLKAKGVEADVVVSAAPPTGPAPKSDLLTGLVLGGVAVGALSGIVALIRRT